MVKAEHFLTARYLAPSMVFYHVAAGVALLAVVDVARAKLGDRALEGALPALAGVTLVSGVLALRAREFPSGFKVGVADYRAFQEHYLANLASGTRLAVYPGVFGKHLFGERYQVGHWPIPLEKFRPRRGVRRYVLVTIHAHTVEREAELEQLAAVHFGMSAEEWRSTPLLDAPHSPHQAAVEARLLELP
jgi:hypothetical protein